jgi:peptide deformylase
MILEIKYWPDQCLRKIAEEVNPQEEGVGSLIADLFATMYENNGMGLAATQCDIQKRVLVLDGTLAGGKERRAFVNPVITEKTEKTIVTMEGCLSFPDAFAKVERHEGVVVECEDNGMTGERETVMLTGVDAVILQHELDHLNGIVFYDYLGPAKKRLVDEKVRKTVKKMNRRKK